ncbi:hypothetical protein [Desulfurobacterium sp.]
MFKVNRLNIEIVRGRRKTMSLEVNDSEVVEPSVSLEFSDKLVFFIIYYLIKRLECPV